MKTISEAPVLLVCGPQADQQRLQQLQDAGVEVLTIAAEDSAERMQLLLKELGRRRMTNVLVEGGGKVLGGLMDLGEIDEVHAFVAPKIVGGAAAPGPVGGSGAGLMSEAKQLFSMEFENLDGDLYVRGRLSRPDA